MSDYEDRLNENTKLTREIHQVLIGQPEYQRPGLVEEFRDMKETVQRHEHIIVRWGGTVAGILFLVEIVKFWI
jgi:hypothetical protein